MRCQVGESEYQDGEEGEAFKITSECSVDVSERLLGREAHAHINVRFAQRMVQGGIGDEPRLPIEVGRFGCALAEGASGNSVGDAPV